MSADLEALEAWVTPLLEQISAQERRTLARQIGLAIRRSQAARIGAQQGPDGEAFEPRKPPPTTTKARQKGGSIRRAMFAKLKTAKHLKTQLTGEGVAIGFLGRAARIAQVHQEGLVDQVERDGPSYRYPARRLLGFTDADRELIKDMLLNHLGGLGST